MYDEIAEVYDFFVNWDARLQFEMPFLLSQLAELGPDPAQVSVLDTACGTGRHAIALAKAHYKASGADLFPKMVSHATANAEAAGLSIPFRTAGFGQIAPAFPGQKFNAVLCLGNSLPHVLSPDGLRAALSDFAALLAPGGKLIIQQRNFDKVLKDKQRWMEPQAHQQDDKEWIFFRFYDYEPDGLIRFNILTVQRQAVHEAQVHVNTTELLPLLTEMIKPALVKAGFVDIALFGSMAGESYSPESSGDLIITARKL